MAPYDCSSDYSCVYHMSNTAFPGLVGCCSDNDCGFTSTCYNSAKISATPSITSGNTAFALFCTESTAAECATFTWGGEDFTDYHCYSTPFIYAVFTTATVGTPTNGSVTMATQYVTKIGDDVLNTYASSFEVSTSGQATTTTAHTHAGNSGKSHHRGLQAQLQVVLLGPLQAVLVLEPVSSYFWGKRKNRPNKTSRTN